MTCEHRRSKDPAFSDDLRGLSLPPLRAEPDSTTAAVSARWTRQIRGEGLRFYTVTYLTLTLGL
jgi:hypothetical protein